MANKATNAEIEQRVNEIYTLLLQAEPTEKIWHYSTKKWGISTRQCDRYIDAAKARMADALAADRQTHLSNAIAQRNDLYRQAYKAKKWFTCLQVADSRDKLLGLEYRLEDHVKAALTAGYVVLEPGAPAEAEGTIADQSAEQFFRLSDSDRATAPDSIDSIQQQ